MRRHVCAHVIGLYKDEDVVDTDGKDKEGNDLYNDEGRWHAHVTEETKRRKDRQKDNGHSSQTKHNLRVHLKQTLTVS